MHLKPSREASLTAGLLTLAEYWRQCADQTDEPWRRDMMRSTADEFESAAARLADPKPQQ